MRPASKSDFEVDVPGIGVFTFARRTMRDTYRIRGEYSHLTGRNFGDDGSVLDLSGFAFASISVRLVDAPDGFSLEKLDPSEDGEDKVLSIFRALCAQEESFRTGNGSTESSERKESKQDV